MDSSQTKEIRLMNSGALTEFSLLKKWKLGKEDIVVLNQILNHSITK